MFLAGFLARFLANSFWALKYKVQYYWDGEIQCTVLPGQRKQTIDYLEFQIQNMHNFIAGALEYYLSTPLNSLFNDLGV